MVLAHLISPRADTEAEIAARPEAWTPGAGWSRKTVAGEVVSPAKAMGLSAWFSAIRCISEDIGKLPLDLYRKLPKGGREVVTDHPVARLLDLYANDEATSNTLRETMTGWALSWGNAFAEIESGPDGKPVALHPIHPSRCWLHRVDGRIVLDVWVADAFAGRSTAVRLDYSEVIHIRGFGDDILVGLSVAKLAAESIGIGLAAQSYGAAFFGNGATPTLLLIHPGKLDEKGQTNLRESWKKRHAGPRNSGGVGVLQEGIKVEKLSIPPEEAQFLETRQFQIADTARWFRIPPHKIGDLTRSTNNNIEHQGIEYATDTLSPWFTRWEQELLRKLFDERDQKVFEIDFDDKALMRGDYQSRMNAHRTAISTGMETPNEARRDEGRNPSPEPGADQLYMQGAMMTLRQIAEGTEKPGRTQVKPEPEPAETPKKPPADDAEEQ